MLRSFLGVGGSGAGALFHRGVEYETVGGGEGRYFAFE
jgi:hypothetical protein